MSETDIKSIIADLDRWALGHLCSKLTWSILEERFGFSRQSLQAKSEIKAAYDNAKQALSGGLVKSKEQTAKENVQLICEIERLKKEVEEFKRKENNWKKRWQRIAFHIRQKGMQVAAIDQGIPEGSDSPAERETSKILRPFENGIPPSGRV
jgi:seryl-tRNA synthetase